MDYSAIWYAPMLRGPANGNDPRYFSFGDRNCILWAFYHADILNNGHWPAEPNMLCESSRSIRHNASYCGPIEIMAEIRRRLDRCYKLDALMCVHRWEKGASVESLSVLCNRPIEWVDKRSTRALNYITKSDFRKRPMYKVWCAHGWQPRRMPVKA